MKGLIVGLMISVGLVGWAQLQPGPPPVMEPVWDFDALDLLFPAFPVQEPAEPIPAPWQVPPGMNDFSVNYGQDLSLDLAVDFSQDLSTILAVNLAQDLSTNLAVNYGTDLSTNLAVNLGQNLATPTWR